MSATLTRLDSFHARWRERLCEGEAEVLFAARPLDNPAGLHCACADRFVTGLGFAPIGGNWELLDAEADMAGPRSARAALVEAFSRNMVFSHYPWLGDDAAAQMGGDFLACFDPGQCQIVTNRMYFGWNPITTATFEWAFVAFDAQAIALLLATAED